MMFGDGEFAILMTGETTVQEILMISADSTTIEDGKKSKSLASSSNLRSSETNGKSDTQGIIINTISIDGNYNEN